MTTLIFKKQPGFTKYFWVAVFIHAIGLNIFSLTIPLYQISTTPSFHFLGAILKPKDFLITSNEKKAQINTEQSKKISSHFVKNPNVSLEDLSVKKPLYSKELNQKKDKEIIKPVFSQEEGIEAQNKEFLKMLGISEKAPSYQPLSLH
ncbi:MAG TPA: hypothetical protein PLH56_01330 [Candidatus Omnitrophota bacterium]|nr:hypothetical protein [Candidatus Omnitrophota bacterium]HPN87961.1 hypothetical protein [Candidatus Omnitrophota bacterium]